MDIDMTYCLPALQNKFSAAYGQLTRPLDDGDYDGDDDVDDHTPHLGFH